MNEADPGSDVGRLVKAQELCHHLAISRSTLWRLRLDGLPVIHMRGGLRFDPHAVQAWLEAAGDRAEVHDAPDPMLPPGDYRCRGCGFVGTVARPQPRSRLVCPHCAGRDVEPVGTA